MERLDGGMVVSVHVQKSTAVGIARAIGGRRTIGNNISQRWLNRLGTYKRIYGGYPSMPLFVSSAVIVCAVVAIAAVVAAIVAAVVVATIVAVVVVRGPTPIGADGACTDHR
jgi:hypothetical protein